MCRLPPSAFWLGCPRPVIYDEETNLWKSKCIWDVRFYEEIGGEFKLRRGTHLVYFIVKQTLGPTVQFRLEKPSIVALAQAKRVNLPLVRIYYTT